MYLIVNGLSTIAIMIMKKFQCTFHALLLILEKNFSSIERRTQQLLKYTRIFLGLKCRHDIHKSNNALEDVESLYTSSRSCRKGKAPFNEMIQNRERESYGSLENIKIHLDERDC
ncbi:CLUMA_CG019323, isoform A [Clunio marinus]|uniref:CLUMA_CG019323, isoform A n=1 Tax=Clunio marinus TaxID=568069 RepID=A0A1J1J2E0_9DIPT|nr:CLUMA_CG019323, isoform A [Clunio marinus]